MRQDAIIRKLEVIGEAVKQLSERTRRQRPEIPWRQIAGMRDRLTHAYFGVDLGLVWRVVERDLQPLEIAVTALLDGMANEENDKVTVEGRAVAAGWFVAAKFSGAMGCKAPRQRWQPWHSWQRGFCKLQILKHPIEFESHLLRQSSILCFQELS